MSVAVAVVVAVVVAVAAGDELVVFLFRGALDGTLKATPGIITLSK